MNEKRDSQRVVNVIIDGYGFKPKVENTILEEVMEELADATLIDIIDVFNDSAEGSDQLLRLHDDDKVKIILSPTPVSLYRSLCYDNANREIISLAKEMFISLTEEDIDGLIREVSRRHNYAIWAANSPYLYNMRNDFPTAITRTSGPEAGYEDIEPRVQGNSDTGHQQLGNLTVAAQLPLQITMSIEEGSFFDNEAFTHAISRAKENGSALNIAVLLSGNLGNNGRVHSCWNHMEAFIKLCFEENQMNPKDVRLFAILDGRDSAPDSSLRQENGEGFLPMLKELLGKYDAVESLAWILGRSYAMDRDYDETKTRQAYLLLTQGEGTTVENFDAAMEEVDSQHKQGATDTTVTAIAISDDEGNTRKIGKEDSFVDLNFRADRQRQLIASLMGAKDFLSEQAGSRKRTWQFDWMDSDLDLTVCCMSEYHPVFEEKYGAKIAYTNTPHAHNYLTLLCERAHRKQNDFSYMLLAESTKSLHVGYFIRGRREADEGSVFEKFEQRRIIGSYGKEKEVYVDDDFYKTPQMKAFEIAGVLANELYNQDLDLAIVNLSNPDMIGHLITKHFEAVVRAIEAIDTVMKFLVPMALEAGYHVIVTADHGNADEFSPAHGANDVLTTVCSPEKPVEFTLNEEDDCIRLFDIPWANLDIMGLSEEIRTSMPEVGAWVKENNLEGRSFFKLG